MERIAIIGLGLMGASLAQALRGFQDAEVVGADADQIVRHKAMQRGIVDMCYQNVEEAVQGADLVIFCVYAHHIPELLKRCLPHLKKGVLLSDICGVKTPLYRTILPLLPPEVDYTGLHPMAGRERDGIDHAEIGLYHGAGMLICPTEHTGSNTVRLMQALAEYIGCARIEEVDYERHDGIIAYTSDLMHISAAGLCLSFHPEMNLTFAAGAFRDCTRVADINAAAWTELLMSNRSNVLEQLERYIEGLKRIADALSRQDSLALQGLLAQAGDNKREMLCR